MHQSVLGESVLSYLDLKPGQIVLDGTIGSGGHAERILKAIGPDEGILIGLDQDEEAIKRTQIRLEKVGGRFVLKHLNFRYLDQALSSLNIYQLHAVLFDIGVSREQLEDSRRGFSFKLDGPLDMRMDQRLDTTAEDFVAKSSYEELETIFRQFGEERYAGRIAKTIVQNRAQAPIKTTTGLRCLIERMTPARYRFGRIHPATRVFQALRIAVNDELNALEEALPKVFGSLKHGGRLLVISFHSLEDRIVKHFFLKQKRSGEGTLITKKPLRPSSEEMKQNPSARSAKLRVIERA